MEKNLSLPRLGTSKVMVQIDKMPGDFLKSLCGLVCRGSLLIHVDHA